jgi:hypothetical protein
LREKIVVAWGDAGKKNNLADIMKGLDQVMTILQSWSKRKFGNVLRELAKARKKIELLQTNNADQREIC